jgi:hypothetical protein
MNVDFGVGMAHDANIEKNWETFKTVTKIIFGKLIPTVETVG